MNGNVSRMNATDSSIKTVAVINLLAGIWLFISPWVYQAYSENNAWNSWIVGALIVILAAIRVNNPMTTRAVSVINLLLGAWTFASPWIYRYTGERGRFINSLCVGVIVLVVGAVASSMGTAGHPSDQAPLRA